jgi:hypothetical protein
MLQRIEIDSAQGALLSLPLEDLDHGFLLEEVQGLDPVKATITTSSFAQLDGSDYQSSRREERNIKLKISLEPDWGVDTIRTLRKRLYEYFMPKSALTLRFYASDADTVWISGRVESFETALFSAEPAVDISIICFDPDFFEPVAIVASGNTVSTLAETLFDYTGTVETGIVFTLRPNRAISSFSIYQHNPSGSIRQLDFSGALQDLDILKISTIQGRKYARLTRNSTETSFLFGISPQSYWPELQPGENYLRVYANGAPIPFDIEYTRKYGGL